jgi:uncharacterized OB-fold protein
MSSPIAGAAATRPFRPGLFEIGDAGVPRLLACACRTCGRTFFPARLACTRCGQAGRIEPQSLAGHGRIYASTIVRVPSPAGLKPPYACGYVELDAAALRVFALFDGVDPAALVPGTRVEMAVQPLRTDADGSTLMAYRFRPLSREAT